MLRTRFRVTEKAELEHYEKGTAWRIKLQGVKAGVFGVATPAANLEMLIVPNKAAAELEVGKIYFADFSLDPDQRYDPDAKE